MARKTLVAGLGIGMLTLAFAQAPRAFEPAGVPVAPLRELSYDAFKPGEKLTYLVHYGLLNAGEAVVELKESEREIQGRKILHAVGKGRSLGAFNLFYKVDDHYETYFDREGVFPWAFIRRVSEGGYNFSQDYVYLQHRQQVNTQKKQTHAVPAHVQDMLSSFYYARTLDLRDAEPGQQFEIQTFIDDELWPLRMRFIGRETIKVRSGRYQCLRFQPVVQEGRIFASKRERRGPYRSRAPLPCAVIGFPACTASPL